MHAPDPDASREEILPPEDNEALDAIDTIVARGPGGAFAVAGLAAGIVIAIFFLFYFFVYLPRGTVQ